eukprot:CAMPEP_0117442806 /NCGR_PEP_ID=MMETSP0759-20121206/4352_1 /TAXON_ID=63605 /ORGANISM="Percolomonas cosmopolitus, Strain WS" /LENGTH=796 /DNA_ID=CAMNT_0005234727 /DNA_START=187 /DNA_END=2574 /DNA_ORIENTATION=-
MPESERLNEKAEPFDASKIFGTTTQFQHFDVHAQPQQHHAQYGNPQYQLFASGPLTHPQAMPQISHHRPLPSYSQFAQNMMDSNSSSGSRNSVPSRDSLGERSPFTDRHSRNVIQHASTPKTNRNGSGTREKPAQIVHEKKQPIGGSEKDAIQGKVLLLVKISRVTCAQNTHHVSVPLEQFLIKVRFNGQARKFDVEDIRLKRHKAVAFKVDDFSLKRKNALLVELHDRKNYNGKKPFASKSILVEEVKQVAHKCDLRGVNVRVRTQVKRDGDDHPKDSLQNSNPLPPGKLKETAASLTKTGNPMQLFSEDTLLPPAQQPPAKTQKSVESPAEKHRFPAAIHYPDADDEKIVDLLLTLAEKHSGGVLVTENKSLCEQANQKCPSLCLEALKGNHTEISLQSLTESLEKIVSKAKESMDATKIKLPCIVFIHDSLSKLSPHMGKELNEFLMRDLRKDIQVYVVGPCGNDIRSPVWSLGIRQMSPRATQNTPQEKSGNISERAPVVPLYKIQTDVNPLILGREKRLKQARKRFRAEVPQKDNTLASFKTKRIGWFNVDETKIDALHAYQVVNREKDAQFLVLTGTDFSKTPSGVKKVPNFISLCTTKECFAWFAALLDLALPESHWKPWMKLKRGQIVPYLLVPFTTDASGRLCVNSSLVAHPLVLDSRIPREGTIKVGSIVGIQRRHFSDIFRVVKVSKWCASEHKDLDQKELETVGVHANMYRNVCTLQYVSPWSEQSGKEDILEYHEDLLRHYQIDDELGEHMDVLCQLISTHTIQKTKTCCDIIKSMTNWASTW